LLKKIAAGFAKLTDLLIFKLFHVFKIYPTSRYENQCQILESIFDIFQDSRNLLCEAEGKNQGKDIGSKGIGAFWP
jgi:hypothetical protein